MRAVWSFSLVLLGCGGRTLDDSVFDEGSRGSSFAVGGFGGNPGLGGSGTFGGSPGVGGSFGFGGTLAAGGHTATGGRPSAGGVFGEGGFTGSAGVFTTGGLPGTGGFVTSGGTGSGGAPFVDNLCVRVCDAIHDLCGVPPGQTGEQCAIGCSQPLVSSSPSCEMATRSLLNCVQKVIAFVAGTCAVIDGAVRLACPDALLKVNACGLTLPEVCTDIGQVSVGPHQCDRIRTCGATEYHTVCTSSANGTHCQCKVNGSTRSEKIFWGSIDACEQESMFRCL
jgi:hypothetical protein